MLKIKNSAGKIKFLVRDDDSEIVELKEPLEETDEYSVEEEDSELIKTLKKTYNELKKATENNSGKI